MKQLKAILSALLALVCALSWSARPALAQVTETVLYSFMPGTDAKFPYAGVILGAGGEVYGITAFGGADPSVFPGPGNGAVFKITPPRGTRTAWSESLLWSFSCGQDGCRPFAPITASNPSGSTLWGSTDFGGQSGHGTVFRLKDGKLSTLWNFTGGADGDFATLTADKTGALYGTAGGGGTSGNGTIFKIDLLSGTLTTIWNFSGSDGASPGGTLFIDDSGAIYGTTGGGLTNPSNNACPSGGCGTVFKLTPPERGQSGWTLTTLYFFTGNADGGQPAGGVVADKSGALYGTTTWGGTFGGSLCGSWGCAVVFKLTPPASGQGPWTETVLWSFSGSADGAAGNGPLLIDRNGALYGTTQYGGYLPCFFSGGFGCGNAFKLTPPAIDQTTWTETTLWSFTGLSDGQTPLAGLVADKKGALYGTTTWGGTFSADPPCQDGCGVVFKLDGTGFAPGKDEAVAVQ